MTGRVILVGAGPGDPELITVRGARALAGADVVLYDRLLHPRMLDHVPDTAELVFVGKDPHKCLHDQDEIHELMTERARAGAVVVRLKCGDPFVFGRGGEEARHLVEAGIPVEIVPGVSSALAGPAAAWIPVTHRGVASSVTFVTGHGSRGDEPDVPWAAPAGVDTLVFLMGVSRRRQIAARLLEFGRPADQPVAFVERATTDQQTVTLSTLGRTAVDPPDVSAPAVFVVGDVVRVREHLAGLLHAAPIAEGDEA